MQTILVFLQASVRHFFVAKLALYNSECVFYFTTDGGFAFFDVSTSIDRVATDLRKAAGAAVHTEINFGKVLVA